MKHMIRLYLGAALAGAITLTALGDDLERLAGRWSTEKKSDDGQPYTQVIEIAKDKLTFRILDADKSVRLYAEGNIKLEKLGPFNVMKITGIKAGASAAEAEPIYDDRTLIYQLGYDTWTVAVNFDAVRDQKPSVDEYRKLRQ